MEETFYSKTWQESISQDKIINLGYFLFLSRNNESEDILKENILKKIKNLFFKDDSSFDLKKCSLSISYLWSKSEKLEINFKYDEKKVKLECYIIRIEECSFKELFNFLKENVLEPKLDEKNQKIIRQLILSQNLLDNILNDSSQEQLKNSFFESVFYQDQDKIFNLLNIILIKMSFIDFSNSEDNKIAFIIGPNGKGKSKLVDYLYVNKFPGIGIKALPANINLKLDFPRYEDSVFLPKDVNKSVLSENRNVVFQAISAIINQTNQQAKENVKVEERLISKTKYFFHMFFPNISVEETLNTKTLNFYNKNNVKNISYEWNDLSDGERKILWFIMQILLAEEKSLIFFDEPENNINPGIYKKFWNEMIKERSDCHFVFVSHSPELINKFKNKALFFKIISFLYPDQWIIEEIKIKNIDSRYLFKIFGEERKLLFCEGDYQSLDYKVYSAIYENDFEVVPVKFKSEVINHVNSFNEHSVLKLENIIAYGIVDSDGAKNNSNIRNVYMLEENEIEMLLLDDEIIKEVLNNKYCRLSKKEIEIKFQEINKKFYKCLNKNLDKIIESYSKQLIDEIKKKHNIFPVLKDDIEKSLMELRDKIWERLPEIDGFKTSLLSFINKKNKKEILKISNLKKILSSNEVIGFNDYNDYAVNVIEKNSGNLQEYIRSKISINKIKE